MESKNLKNMEPMEVRLKISASKLAIVISVLSLLLSAYSIFRPFDKGKIIVTSDRFLGLGVNEEKIYIRTNMSFLNLGMAASAISKIEAIVISKGKDAHGNPNYMRHFSDVLYCEMRNPFLGFTVSPSESLDGCFDILQESRYGFGSFAPGKYEYLIAIRDEKDKQLYVMLFEFSIDDEYTVGKILSRDDLEYINIIPIQNRQRVDELLKTIEAFKQTSGIGCNLGCDENDLLYGVKFEITYDPNGGTGGNIFQLFLAGSWKGIPIDGGIPVRSGYRFSHWSRNPDGSGDVCSNGQILTFGGNVTLYAVWELDNNY